MENLTIIGTSHIAKEAVEKVKTAIETGGYEIVLLELDSGRLQGMLSKTKAKMSITDVKRVGVKGYTFSIIGAYAEKKLGQAVGVKPGEEMLTAYKIAKKNGLKIGLIDQPIEVTLQRFSKQITWKEKWHFLVDIIKGLIFRKPEIQLDLSKVPSDEVIEQLMSKVKPRYPNFYRVLVTERNIVMARKINAVMRENPGKKALAIVGAGHEKEISRLLSERSVVSYSYSVGK